MKAVVVCVLALAALAAARPEEYDSKYDNVDVEEVLTNKRLLGPYVKCLLEEGKCSPEGKELKSHIKDALETFCGKCNETQKSKTRVVIGHLINHETEYWNQLKAKYDPEDKYSKKYESELKTLKA